MRRRCVAGAEGLAIPMNAELVIDRSAQGGDVIDRWFYVFMAALYLAVAVLGFAPRSVQILTGELRNPPLVVHVHAALMTAWLVLFLTQTSLVALGERRMHRRLGILSFVLAPAMLASMFGATLSWHTFMSELDPNLSAFGTNMLLSFYRSMLFFPIFFVWGAVTRRNDPETHKRMMVLATVLLTSGGIDRMSWLPGQTLPGSYDGTHFYQLVLFAPALAYDFIRRGRPHPAYLIGFGLLLAWMIATHFLWGSEWWLTFSPRLLAQ